MKSLLSYLWPVGPTDFHQLKSWLQKPWVHKGQDKETFLNVFKTKESCKQWPSIPARSRRGPCAAAGIACTLWASYRIRINAIAPSEGHTLLLQWLRETVLFSPFSPLLCPWLSTIQPWEWAPVSFPGHGVAWVGFLAQVYDCWFWKTNMSINSFGYPSLPSLVSPYRCSFSSRYKLISNRPSLEMFGGSNKKVKGDLTWDNTEKILTVKSRALLQIKYQTHCPTSKHIKSS